MGALTTVKFPSVQQIEGSLEEETRRFLQSSLDQLAALGIEVGAKVGHGHSEQPPKTYRITRIAPSVHGFGRCVSGVTLWCYGVQLRRDGSWGTHEHSIAQPHELTVNE